MAGRARTQVITLESTLERPESLLRTRCLQVLGVRCRPTLIGKSQSRSKFVVTRVLCRGAKG
eukprot:4127576-Alexandrium_andersonii.AAC.1